MSETRQSRKLLRESLVQHTFHYFDELKKTNSESDARSFVHRTANIVFKRGDAGLFFVSS